MKTPSSTVFPTADFRPEKAWKIKTQIEKSVVRDFIMKHTYDNTVTSQLQQYLNCPDNQRWDNKNVPAHILTCHFSRKKMIQRDITLQDVVLGVRKLGKNIVVAYFDNLLDDIQLFVRVKNEDKFFKYVKMVMDTTIRGSKHIQKVNIREEMMQFVVETEGIDLMHLKTLQSIDHSKTQCNDIFAIRKVFGIEAARAVLLKEMHQVLSAYGIYVNMRHFMVIIDWMTWGGTINALTRHGVKKMMDDSTPLKRATFEQPVEIFHAAAVKGLKDTLSGVSEQLLIGNPPKIGSYYNDVVTDQDYQKMWDNDNWKPQEEIVEDNLFGDWTGAAPTSEWDSHQTFANEKKVDVLRQQQKSAWQQIQTQQQSAAKVPWLRQQAVPSWQTNQATVPAWQQQQSAVPLSPDYAPKSPDYAPDESPPSKKQKICSPANSGTYIAQSPTYGPSDSPMSPAYSPMSPAYSPSSPAYSPTSPQYTPKKKKQKLYSPTMNNYNTYSPSSPQYTPQKKKQKLYSPTNK